MSRPPGSVPRYPLIVFSPHQSESICPLCFHSILLVLLLELTFTTACPCIDLVVYMSGILPGT